jgi:hypothetical protein
VWARRSSAAVIVVAAQRKGTWDIEAIERSSNSAQRGIQLVNANSQSAMRLASSVGGGQDSR